jgi:hypothetical protein
VEDAAHGPEGARSWGVALYDSKSGRIAHVQRVMVLAGAPDLTLDQVVERAFVHARHAGHDTSQLQALHLAADHDYAVSHVVDVASGTLIESPRGHRAEPL